MAKKKISAQIIVCDVCGKEASDNGQTYYGGHPFHGWFTVNYHNFSTSLRSLQLNNSWDFCSEHCLRQHYGLGKVES